MKEFLKKLKSFSGFIGSASTLIPGISFYLKYSPPLIEGIWILVCALSAAFLWFGFRSSNQDSKNIHAIKFILSGFLSAIIYFIILNQTSILVHSGSEEARYQIGWNISNWSLEKDAINKINSKICKSDTKEDLLYCYTVNSETISSIWKSWTIYTFGILNILIFTTSSLLWSYGWGKIIKMET